MREHFLRVTTTEWIEVTTDTLKRLSILNNSTNIYEAGTSKEVFFSKCLIIFRLTTNIPKVKVNFKKTHTNFQHRPDRPESLKTSCAHVSFQGGGREQRPCSVRPPLPSRRPPEPLKARRSGSFSDLPLNGVGKIVRAEQLIGNSVLISGR